MATKGENKMKKIEQWTQETVRKKPTKEELKGFNLTKRVIHFNATANGKAIIIDTYSKGTWQPVPDINHVYEEKDENIQQKELNI